MKTAIQISTKYFLDEIHGKGNEIYLNVGYKTWSKPRLFDNNLNSLLEWINTEKTKDICYIVNSGGSKDIQITNVNAVFADWDCGKDPDDRYFPLYIVNSKKEKFLPKVMQFPLVPSFIVETRNGYQVYWLLYPGTSNDIFTHLQKRIAHYFASDPSVCNPARVMRLPGYNWVKPNSGCDPFFVSIIEYNPVRYPYSDLLEAFPPLPEDTYTFTETTSENMTGRKGAHNNIYIKRNTRNIIMGTKPETTDSQEPVILDTMEDVVDYLCRQNIAEYLDISGFGRVHEDSLTVRCPIHNDNNPSASIYYHDDGYCYLKCHSSNCTFGSGTLIKVVEGKYNITEGEAVAKLIEYYNIKLDDAWKEKEEEKYSNNIEIIEQLNRWKETHPDLHRCVNRIKADLLSKLVFGKEHIQLRTTQGKSLFFCSLTEFERIHKKNPYLEDQGRQNERIDRYCLLGLMEKIDKNEIPRGIYRNLQEVKDLKRFQYRMQCYHIPEYTTELFQKADDIARIAKEKGMKLNSITKNSVRDIFGKDVARKMYPQSKDIQPTDSGAKFSESVEKVMLEEIAERGYATTSAIKESLRGVKTWKNVHDRRVKEHLPGLIIRHELIEITSNKKFKEKYNIDSKGYPKIIIRKPDVTRD